MEKRKYTKIQVLEPEIVAMQKGEKRTGKSQNILDCNGMSFRSMEELLPIIEREGLRVEIQSHPYDFCELNDETCDIVKSFRSKNLGYVYSASHGFFYDQGRGDVRHMLKYAGDELTHMLLADTWNQTKDCRYILNPP